MSAPEGETDRRAHCVIKGMEKAIKDGYVTYDLERLMKAEGRKDVVKVSCSGFGKAIAERM